MRCVAHILNLIVRDGLSELKGAITKALAAVKYVRSSLQRQQLFKVCAEKEGTESDSLLSLDVPTRWNSTFLMLERAIKFQKAFDRLDEEDDKFNKEFDELELDGPPSPMDWNDCMLITKFLKKFYDATNQLSAYLHVSSNLYFTEVCDIVGPLNELSMMEDSFLRSMSIKMRLKLDKYWEPIDKMNMRLLVAVVLDPRYKLKYVKFCYSYYFKLQLSNVIELTQKLRNALDGIYEEYKQYGSGTASSSSQTSEIEVDQSSLQARDPSLVFEKHLEEEECEGDKSEVDTYLEEAREKKHENTKFEILSWWKTNSVRYHVPSQVARDILAIHVSTVASEAAFSTGGRVLDRFRSSLFPKLMECLICTQDWLRVYDTSIPDVEEIMEEFADLETLDLGLTS